MRFSFIESSHNRIEEATLSQRPDWQLIFTLPNLKLGGHHLSPDQIDLGLNGIAIVPASDSRVMKIRDWSRPADKFLNAFHDGNGNPIEPCALILQEDWAAELGKDPEPVIAFRNAAAMSAVLLARARHNGGSWLGASWSDTFDYHPAQLRLDGADFDLVTPALTSFGFQLRDLSLTPDLGLPRSPVGKIDEPLARRLGRAWRLRYRRGREKGATSRVFRSLEAAYEASAISFKSYSSLNELGMNAVDWTTGIEVLASPRDRYVNKWDCSELIGEAKWPFEPELQHRKYRERRGRKKEIVSLNLAQKIFFYLHRARSKFVHGDRVSSGLLLPFGENAPSLLSLASTIYRTALLSYLERHWPRTPSPDGVDFADFFPGMAYRKHLLAVVDPGKE